MALVGAGVVLVGVSRGIFTGAGRGGVSRIMLGVGGNMGGVVEAGVSMLCLLPALGTL